ncbi:hypothetical protein [Streptomyces sp. NPDC088752]|uniref:hypothetical protein n=1 Tax=Streptomyces sp. NPDC088752 TaxID=3154963 RepID=UPI003448D8CE
MSEHVRWVPQGLDANLKTMLEGAGVSADVHEEDGTVFVHLTREAAYNLGNHLMGHTGGACASAHDDR